MADQDDTRAAGGKAPRRGGWSLTPQRMVQGALGLFTPRRASAEPPQAAPQPPPAPEPVVPPAPAAQAPGSNSKAQAPAPAMPAPAPAMAPLNLPASAPEPVLAAPSSGPGLGPLSQLANGWSPDKAKSLNSFLIGSEQTEAPSQSLTQSGSTARPYVGLKWLLNGGRPDLPQTFTQGQGSGFTLGATQRTQPAANNGPARRAPLEERASSRYAPYPMTTTNRSRPSLALGVAARQGAAQPAPTPTRNTAALPPAPGPLPITPAPQLVAATAPAAPPAGTPAGAGPSAPPQPRASFGVMPSPPPMLIPIAPTPHPRTGLSARPGAGPSSVMATPTLARTPAFGGVPAFGATPGMGAVAGMNVTPGLAGGMATVAATPLLGGGGGTQGTKRAHPGGTDAPVRTPLIGSGVKMSAYKKQRDNRYGENSNAIFKSHTPRAGNDSRSNSATPAGSAEKAPGANPALAGVQPTTPAARRILEALQTHERNTPKPTEAAPNTAAKTPKANTFGNPGHTPFPKGAPPPPLDHLSPATTTTGRYGLNLFGNSPAPSGTTTSQGTANGASSVLGVSKSGASDTTPAATPAAAASTPGAVDCLEGLRPATGSGRTRSGDGKPKSVRWAVPDDEANTAVSAQRAQATPAAQPAAAAPAPAPPASTQATPTFGNGGVRFGAAAETTPANKQLSFTPVATAQVTPPPEPVPVFSFGAAPSAEASQIAEATRKAIKGVSASDEFGIVAPTFTFGQAAAPTAGQTAVTPDLAAVKKKDVGADKPGGLLGGGGAAAAGGFGAQSPQDLFCQAIAVPLPPDDDEDDTTAPAAATHTTNTTPAATPAAQPAAAPVSNGWGDAFLKANEATAKKANAEVAKEIEKAAKPASSEVTVGAAVPAAGFNFGTAAAAGPSATPAAPAANLFGFGSPAPVAAATPPAAETPAPPAAAPAASAGGWGDAFLKANAEQSTKTTAAVAKEIESHKTGGGAAATTPTPAAQAGATTTSATPTFTFGASPLPAFGTQTQTQVTTPAPAAASPPPTFGLGGTLMSPAPGGPAGFSFGAAPAAASAAATTPAAPASTTPLFGASPAPAGGLGALFGSTPQTQAFGTATETKATTPSLFGAQPSSTESPGLFGQAAAAFGGTAAAQTPAPAAAPSSTGFTFGATPGPAATGTPSTPTFTFGGAPAAAQAAFGTQQPAAAAAPFTFGASPAPAPAISPAPAANSNPFGAPGGGFGAQQQQQGAPASPPLFGGASATPTFGATSSTPAFGAGAAAPTFGAGPSPNPAGTPQQAFGFGGNAGAGFVFGGAGANAPPSVSPFGGGAGAFGAAGATPSPAPTFGGLQTPPTLGGANTANAGHTPFQFGGAGATPNSMTPMSQPQFGTPAQPPAQAEGGGGNMLGMNLNDMRGTDGGRRKIRARRHG